MQKWLKIDKSLKNLYTKLAQTLHIDDMSTTNFARILNEWFALDQLSMQSFFNVNRKGKKYNAVI